MAAAFTHELGFIGGGNMAEAIVRAAVDQQIVPADRIIVADPQADRLAVFQELGAATSNDNRRIVTSARQIVLAIKPQALGDIAGDLSELDPEHQILISIMAGVTCRKIEQAIGRPLRIIRIMPNTPLLVGQGMSAIAAGPNAHEGDQLLAMQLFGAAGEAIAVDEAQLDAVTAVSGSGPAYLFYLAEAMAAAARELGLDEEQATLLSQQTVFGAARLLHESDDSAMELRRKVTSPGGTTQAALESMEAAGVKQQIITAIKKAAARSAELGR